MCAVRSLSSSRRQALEGVLGSCTSREIRSVSWNAYSSTFDTYILDSTAGRAFAKYGATYTDQSTGHSRGLGNELKFYRHYTGVPGLAPLLGETTTSDGERLLVIRHIEGARLAHDTRSEAIIRAIRGLAQLHDSLEANGPAVVANRFDAAYFMAWDARIDAMSAAWVDRFPWMNFRLAEFADYLDPPFDPWLGIINGELFANNVLMNPAGDPYFVDWDAWGCGSRFLDLAALTIGWPGLPAEECIETYRSSCIAPTRSAGECAFHAARVYVGVATLWDKFQRGFDIDTEDGWLGDLRRSLALLLSIKQLGA